MLQKLPVNGFKPGEDLTEFDEYFIKSYYEKSKKGYFLKLDIQYPKNLHKVQNDLLFFSERMNIEKVESLLLTCMTRMNMFFPNTWIIFKKVHRVMSKELGKKVKNSFEKNIFKLMNNSVSRKTMENVRKHRDIKLVITKKRRNYLLSEPNYHSTKFFRENLLTIEIRKTQTLMNKPVYLSLSILELSKIIMYEFWYNNMKPKYEEKSKLCFIDTDIFIVYIKNIDKKYW